MKVYRYQYENNPVYKQYCDLIRKTPAEVKQLDQVPYLPIQFFKTHDVICQGKQAEQIFTSSGTTGMVNARHLVADVTFYERSYLQSFQQFYGNIENYAILALLPNYLERDGSSLIYMIEDLIKSSNHPQSGFYLYEHDQLIKTIQSLEQAEQPTLLIGVTYALLDLIEAHPLQLEHTIIMETGGMKGRRKEMIREELHAVLSRGFGVGQIHSEYGMSELLSQAYSLDDGIFECPNWMQISARETTDPFQKLDYGRTGGLNVIDLANLHSCSFIATQDLGKVYANGSFEVLGRFDNSDIRGCNLLVQ